MTNVTNNEAGNWYTAAFKAWQKGAGSKPTPDMLNNIHLLQARPGKQALACAMSLRPEGVTNAQIILACGNPQLNKMRGFISDGLLKRVATSPAENGHTVYKLELTAKGKAKIDRQAKAVAKAAEAGDAVNEATPKAKAKKATSKPRKVKAAPASDVTGSDGVSSEAATVDQPETANQPVA